MNKNDKHATPSYAADKAPEAEGEIVAFSRWRGLLARARQSGRVDALLSEPDAKALVQSIPAQELYYFIKEVGIEDAAELVVLATAEQFQGFVDLDVWQRDRLIAERLEPWLEAVLDAGPATVARIVNEIDRELITLFLRNVLVVYDLSLEEPIEPEGYFYPTPDHSFLLDIQADGERGRRAERLIDWLYRADLRLAREVLMAAKWELQSDLEEWAYRWRSGRMADLGYPEYHEALEVYRWLDPTTVALGEYAAAPGGPEVLGSLPPLLAEPLRNAGLLGRALRAVGDLATIERIQRELVALINRVMAADRIDPSDLGAAPREMERTSAYLSLGLEYLGRGDFSRVLAALSTVPIMRLFRLGYSLTLQLKRAADTLARRGWVTLVPGRLTLLDTPLRDILDALRQPHPVYSLALEDGNPLTTRPFATLEEIARAAHAIEQAALLGPFVRDGLGVSPRLLSREALAGCRPGVTDVTFNIIGATLAAHILLGHPPAAIALERDELPTVREHALVDGDGPLRPSARLAVHRALLACVTERHTALPPYFDAWVDAWLEQLQTGLIPAPDGRGTLVEGILMRIQD